MMTWERVAPEPLLDKKASKNERIAILEDQIALMSFERANSKAFKDNHRSTRRVSSTSNVVFSHDSYDSEDSDQSEQALRAVHNRHNPGSRNWYKVNIRLTLVTFPTQKFIS